MCLRFVCKQSVENHSVHGCHTSLERWMAATPMNLFRRQSASSGTSRWRMGQQWSGWSRHWRDLPRREVLTHAAGEADTAAQVLAVFAATFGDHWGLSALLTSFHGQVVALTVKTAELQAELWHQSTWAPWPKVCYCCKQPGHFQQDCVERHQYAQWQQGCHKLELM